MLSRDLRRRSTPLFFLLPCMAGGNFLLLRHRHVDDLPNPEGTRRPRAFRHGRKKTEMRDVFIFLRRRLVRRLTGHTRLVQWPIVLRPFTASRRVGLLCRGRISIVSGAVVLMFSAPYTPGFCPAQETQSLQSLHRCCLLWSSGNVVLAISLVCDPLCPPATGPCS